MTALRNRVIGALRLQPMSIQQVARCLSVHPETARMALRQLQHRGTVRINGWTPARVGKNNARAGKRSAVAFSVVDTQQASA